MIEAVAAAIVILAAILGSVLGSRATAAAATQSRGVAIGGSETVIPAESSPSAAPRPEKLRQGSPMTVTAIRKVDGGMELFLFY